MRKWLLLVAYFMRLGLFSDQHCSSAVRNVYSGLPLALLIRKIPFRNDVHYFSDSTLEGGAEGLAQARLIVLGQIFSFLDEH
ncbi:hypothetical protein [Rubritalea tangerina]|uniref:hypothetical protein n=1 Tax=Rubritalea tangerina TaxID=430798 RepID=UPI003618C00B